MTVKSPTIKPEIFIENKVILESSDVKIKCLNKYSYPYPTFTWFQNNKEITIYNHHHIVSIEHKLIDKETNSIESTLILKNINRSMNMNNFTCKLLQVQDMIDEIGGNIGKREQYWQTSEQVMLSVSFKQI